MDVAELPSQFFQVLKHFEREKEKDMIDLCNEYESRLEKVKQFTKYMLADKKREFRELEEHLQDIKEKYRKEVSNHELTMRKKESYKASLYEVEKKFKFQDIQTRLKSSEHDREKMKVRRLLRLLEVEKNEHCLTEIEAERTCNELKEKYEKLRLAYEKVVFEHKKTSAFVVDLQRANDQLQHELAASKLHCQEISQLRSVEYTPETVQNIISRDRNRVAEQITEAIEEYEENCQTIQQKHDTISSDNSKGYSEAYIGFKAVMDSKRFSYQVLNPFFGPVAICLSYMTEPDTTVHPSLKKFLQNGVISTLSIWEDYIGDTLSEAFDIMVTEFSGTPMEEWGNDSFDCCDQLMRKWKHCQEAINIGNNLINCPLRARDALIKHKNRVLKHTRPLLQGSHGIDDSFQSLFYPKHSSSESKELSSFMAGNAFTYSYVLQNGDAVKVQIEDPQLLHDILHLYYGIRCTFAHGRGNNYRTFEKPRGSLYKFPESHNELPFVGVVECSDPAAPRACEVAQELLELFKGVQRCGKEVNIDYPTLVNLNRFFVRASHFLPLAIGHMLKRDLDLTLWGFDQQRFSTHKPEL